MQYIDRLTDKNRDRVNVSKLINLTKREKHFLKTEIYCNGGHTQSYNYYGSIENVQSYLQEQLIGENDEIFIKILIKIINKVGRCYPDKKHIWLSVRSKNPYVWKNVRWHVDGDYYEHSNDELHSKFIATLCGPQTYGINATPLDRQAYKEFRTSHCIESFTPKKININYSIIKVGKNHNSYECRQIHSEPVNIIPNKRRVFLSILYGTEEEIDSFK